MILTLGRGRDPLRGPRPVKPPALPEDTYFATQDILRGIEPDRKRKDIPRVRTLMPRLHSNHPGGSACSLGSRSSRFAGPVSRLGHHGFVAQRDSAATPPPAF